MTRLVRSLFMVTGGVALAFSIFAFIEVLLDSPRRARRNRSAAPELPVTPEPAAVQQSPERKFSIKRTKSDVGFVYWVLEGYGPYKCLILCDSWGEAVQQAKIKLAEVEQPA